MRARVKTHTGYGQFRWVVLLLVVVVILPTVCLLWFMSEVTHNQRLVIRQKLVDDHKKRLDVTLQDLDEKAARLRAPFERDQDNDVYETFISATRQGGYDTLLIYDDSGQRLYPKLSTDTDRSMQGSKVFPEAWQLEFVDRHYAQAVQLYKQHVISALATDWGGRLMGKKSAEAVRQGIMAMIGHSRCLAKMDRIDEAIAVCRGVTSGPFEDVADPEALSLVANAHLLMIDWMQPRLQYSDLLQETFAHLQGMLYRANSAGTSLAADQNLFIAQRAVEIAEKDARLNPMMQRTSLQRLIAAETRAIELAERFPTAAALETWQIGKLTPLPSETETPYSLLCQSGSRRYLALLSNRTIETMLAEFGQKFHNDFVDYRILDDTGQPVMGAAETATEPFDSGPIGAFFPGWQIELFFRQNDVLDEAAGRQIAFYTWIGALLILMILASGAVAAKTLGRQVKLNRLKNDFIATVTHELKTPLASMRVLVDTLLEGNYRDQQQVTEYLELVSKENARLTRLIDNFLTFSRMERNKQAFQLRPTSPAVIARTAAEAIQTKFSRNICRLHTDIPDELPDTLADVDAMVTVLVNLLDNACKYTGENKEIALRVRTENGSVCFAVKDNGVGIPPRAAKRIFRRFYQVDRRLARRAEGCGLGLSIAKFIVDAHHGSIHVESTPGRGSTFTVKLPAATAHV